MIGESRNDDLLEKPCARSLCNVNKPSGRKSSEIIIYNKHSYCQDWHWIMMHSDQPTERIRITSLCRLRRQYWSKQSGGKYVISSLPLRLVTTSSPVYSRQIDVMHKQHWQSWSLGHYAKKSSVFVTFCDIDCCSVCFGWMASLWVLKSLK